MRDKVELCGQDIISESPKVTMAVIRLEGSKAGCKAQGKSRQRKDPTALLHTGQVTAHCPSESTGWHFNNAAHYSHLITWL